MNEADLHAYVDGHLMPHRRAEVEAYLEAHPDEAARIAAYRRFDASLREAYAPWLEAPVPAHLHDPVVRTAWPRRIAAAAAWLGIGVALGWSLAGRQVAVPGFDERLVHDASRAHAVYAVEVRHPVEVGAEEEAHLAAWLSKRLGAELRPPALGEAGYHLVGGRLLPADDGPAAQFMYEDGGGRRLTLYVRRATADTGTTAFQYRSDGDLGVFYWIDGSFGYALSGELPRAQLLHTARVAYRGFNP
ncbi:MAG: anti-sigma factor [Gammaproteobacteria bacterium]|nr:anti-sigma factor [Gammaproteobacteria bacterium]